MSRGTSKKPKWRMNHYLDPDEASEFVSAKLQELAAEIEIFAHAASFAIDDQELKDWSRAFEKRCEAISRALAECLHVADKDDFILMVLNARGRQALKTQLASAAVQLDRAKALRHRS